MTRSGTKRSIPTRPAGRNLNFVTIEGVSEPACLPLSYCKVGNPCCKKEAKFTANHLSKIWVTKITYVSAPQVTW
jgi:hypothetical protein